MARKTSRSPGREEVRNQNHVDGPRAARSPSHVGRHQQTYPTFTAFNDFHWSPTVVLVQRLRAYIWQSGRDA